MAKYYVEEHELGYKRIKAQGMTSWDELHGHRDFDDFALRPILEAALPQMEFATSSKRALEYGCGTGPGACFLAERGFHVEGIDICPLAIEMAKQLAAQRGLDIAYSVADMCQLPAGEPVYDLVVDSFCLQCIVTDIDRARVLSAVRSRLKSSGYYLIGTAIYAPDREYTNSRFDEESGISYIPLEGKPSDFSDFEDALPLGESWYLPNRRHLKPPALREELECAGFNTLWHSQQGRNMGLLCQRTS